MAHNLTEVETYTADVSVPDDGDARNAASVEGAFQALANRAKYLKGKADLVAQFALYTISGAAVAQNANATLTETYDPATAYALASNVVSFPAVGYYAISCRASYTSSDASTNPRSIGITALLNSVDVAEAIGYRFSATAAHIVTGSFHRILQITDIATQTIRLILSSGASNTTSLSGVNNYFSIARLS